MKGLSCWEIMNCHGTDCQARKNPELECWEVVKQLGDYRSEFDICSDCLVYVLKGGSMSLSESELDNITAQRIDCVLAP